MYFFFLGETRFSNFLSQRPKSVLKLHYYRRLANPNENRARKTWCMPLKYQILQRLFRAGMSQWISILNFSWNFQNYASRKHCVTFNFGHWICGQKNGSGTWIYLSKLLLSPEVSFHHHHWKCSLGKWNGKLWERVENKTLTLIINWHVDPPRLQVLSRLIYIKKSSALLCPSNVRAIYHLPYVSHYQRKTTIFVVRCSGFIFNYSDNPTRNLFITQYRQNVFKNPCVTNMKTNIWKYFLPLFREIVALLDKRSHLRDVHAVNNLLHVFRITLWTQGTQHQPAAKRYYLACLMFLFPICFMIES